MFKKKILLVGLFFIISVFSLHFLFVPKAYADMTCSWVAGGDNVDDYPQTGAVNRDYFFHVDANKLSSDVILGRYFSYGDGGWVSVSATSSYSDYDWLSVPLHKYLLGKDYTAGGGWLYQNGSGQVKTLSCPICTRIYDVREVKNFGVKTLTYPTKTSDTQVVSGSKAYLGPFWSYNTSAFNGNNNGFLPDPAIVGGDLNAWWWRVGTDYDYGGNGVTAGWFGHNGIFRDGSYYDYPSLLSQSVTFNLTAATFKAGEGTDAYANYDFNNMTVYSRDLQKNTDGTCGSLPAGLSCPNVTAACGVGANTVVVSWDTVSWASSYKITRDATTMLAPAHTAASTTFTDTTAQCNNPHYYYVNPNPLTPECTKASNTVTCPCGGPTNTPTPTPGGPTATPTPGGSCLSSCPSQPVLSPVDKSTNPPTFSWTLATWGTYCPGQNNTYQVLIANLNFSDPGFTSANIVHDHTITTNNLAPTYVPAGFTFANDTYYYWKVIAKNGN